MAMITSRFATPLAHSSVATPSTADSMVMAGVMIASPWNSAAPAAPSRKISMVRRPTPRSARAVNMVLATPAWLRMPTPMTETLATSSFTARS